MGWSATPCSSRSEYERSRMTPYHELLECGNGPIADMAVKCESVFATHRHALVSVSVGADSDVMVDLVERVRIEQPIEVTYVWFDTGMELDATRDQLAYLEHRYGVGILRERALKTIPVCCREFGQPFVSKMASRQISTLQRGGFLWEDEPYGVLVLRYPNMNVSAIKWWANEYATGTSMYRVDRNPWLKEFMTDNPPDFEISDKCCAYAKKGASADLIRRVGADLSMIGVRRSEGGTRQLHDSCFDHGARHDTYRPLFWLTSSDREAYEGLFGIEHSACYSDWGFARTGCTGCPFAADAEWQLDVIEDYEPRMARAARKVFAESYEYTRAYREYRARRTIEDEEHMRDVKRRRSESLKKAVVALDGSGNVVATYPSQLEASAATGVAQSSISRCALGKRPTAGGYAWRFASDVPGGPPHEA